MILGELKEGIYVVNAIKNGKQLTKVADRISELPDALNLATFEPHVYNISKKLSKLLKNNEETYSLGLSKFVTSREIVDTIRSCLKKPTN